MTKFITIPKMYKCVFRKKIRKIKKSKISNYSSEKVTCLAYFFYFIFENFRTFPVFRIYALVCGSIRMLIYFTLNIACFSLFLVWWSIYIFKLLWWANVSWIFFFFFKYEFLKSSFLREYITKCDIWSDYRLFSSLNIAIFSKKMSKFVKNHKIGQKRGQKCEFWGTHLGKYLW